MDRLIPSVDDLAAAGQMGLGPEVERMANDVARYANALESFLGALSADPLSRAAGGFRALSPEEQDNAIRVIEKNIPADFGTFLEIVYLAYYSQPDGSPPDRVGRPSPAARGIRPAAIRRVNSGDGQEARTFLASDRRLMPRPRPRVVWRENRCISAGHPFKPALALHRVTGPTLLSACVASD